MKEESERAGSVKGERKATTPRFLALFVVGTELRGIHKLFTQMVAGMCVALSDPELVYNVART